MRKSLVAAIAAAGIVLTACAGGSDAPLTVPDFTASPSTSPTGGSTDDTTSGGSTDDTGVPGVDDATVLEKVRDGEVLTEKEAARYRAITEKEQERLTRYGPATGGTASTDAPWKALLGFLPQSEVQTSGVGTFTADEVNDAAQVAAYATKSNLGLDVVKYQPSKTKWSMADYQRQFRATYMTNASINRLAGLAEQAEQSLVRGDKTLAQVSPDVRHFWSWFPAGICVLGAHIERDPCIDYDTVRFGVESVTAAEGTQGVTGLRIQTVTSYTAHIWTAATVKMRVTYTLWRNPIRDSPVKWVIGDVTFMGSETEVASKPYWTPPEKDRKDNAKAAGEDQPGGGTVAAFTPVVAVLNAMGALVTAPVTPACTGNACGGGGSGTGPIGGGPGDGGSTPDPGCTSNCDTGGTGGGGGGGESPPLVCPAESSTVEHDPPLTIKGTVTDPNTGAVMGTVTATTTTTIQAPYGTAGSIQTCVTVSTSISYTYYSPPLSAASTGPCLTDARIYLQGPYTRDMERGQGWKAFPAKDKQDVLTTFGGAYERLTGDLSSGLECLNAQSTRLNFDENLTLYGRYAGNYTSYARNVTIVWVPSWEYARHYYPTTYRGVSYRVGTNVASIGGRYLFEDTDWRFTRNCQGFFNRTGQSWGDGALNFYTENFCGPGPGPGGGGGNTGDVAMQCVNWGAASTPMYRVENSNGTSTDLNRTTGLIEVRANNSKPVTVDWRPSGLTPLTDNTLVGAGIRITSPNGNTTYPVLAYQWASRFDLASAPERRSPSLASSSPSSTVRQKAADDNSPSQPYFVLELDEERALRLSRWYGDWDVATTTLTRGQYDSAGKVDGLRAGFLMASRQGRDWQVTPTWRHSALTRIPTDVIEAFRLSQGGLGQPITVVPVYGTATEEVVVTLDCSGAPTRLRATEVNVTGR